MGLSSTPPPLFSPNLSRSGHISRTWMRQADSRIAGGKHSGGDVDRLRANVFFQWGKKKLKKKPCSAIQPSIPHVYVSFTSFINQFSFVRPFGLSEVSANRNGGTTLREGSMHCQRHARVQKSTADYGKRVSKCTENSRGDGQTSSPPAFSVLECQGRCGCSQAWTEIRAGVCEWQTV